MMKLQLDELNTKLKETEEELARACQRVDAIESKFAAYEKENGNLKEAELRCKAEMEENQKEIDKLLAHLSSEEKNQENIERQGGGGGPLRR